MYGEQRLSRERAGSIVAVVAIHLALGYALLTGLATTFPRQVAESLATFTVLPPLVTPQPKPRPKRQRNRAPRKEGAASPANLTAKATEIVAPSVVIPPPQPPPVVTATKAWPARAITAALHRYPDRVRGAAGSARVPGAAARVMDRAVVATAGGSNSSVGGSAIPILRAACRTTVAGIGS